MAGWFNTHIVATGRLPLFCFFVAFIAGFGFIRLSVRLIRAQVRWWPGNIAAGDTHVHHVVFGVVLMAVGGVAEIAAPIHSLFWRTAPAALFGVGTALVLVEFALILHLRDVYWTKEGRLSVDAVFVAIGITALLLIGATPVGVGQGLPHTGPAIAEFVVTVAVLFTLAAVTLLKGKLWTGLLGLFFPRCSSSARCGSAAPTHRPLIRWKTRLQDLLAGRPDQPAGDPERRRKADLSRA